MLQTDAGKTAALARAETNSWSVGDAASFLEVAPEGNRVLTDVSIDGKNSFPSAGERLNLSAAPTEHAIGAALLNEYGEVIGVVGGSLIPGASSMDLLQVAASPAPAGGRIFMRGGLAVPIHLVAPPSPETPATTLAALSASGQFLPAVTARRNVSYGQLARALERKGGLPWPVEGGNQFSRRNPKMVVYVLWEAKEKVKGTLTMRIYDLDNRQLNQPAPVKPMRLNLRPGNRTVTTWQLDVGRVPPAIYRVDVWLNDTPVWRTFFRVTD